MKNEIFTRKAFVFIFASDSIFIFFSLLFSKSVACHHFIVKNVELFTSRNREREREKEAWFCLPEASASLPSSLSIHVPLSFFASPFHIPFLSLLTLPSLSLSLFPSPSWIKIIPLSYYPIFKMNLQVTRKRRPVSIVARHVSLASTSLPSSSIQVAMHRQ